jgi:hybrid cluster-associated redox disulfide protein
MIKKITKKMFIDDILGHYPVLVDILVKKYGFHCVGCMAARMESLEDGAKVHGMDTEKINKMVKYLNQQTGLDKIS